MPAMDEAVEAVKDWLVKHKGEWLLIIDNADAIYATYRLAYTAGKARCISAAYLIMFLGSLDGISIPEKFLSAPKVISTLKNMEVNYAEDYIEARKVLLSFSLIYVDNSNDEGPTVSMHPMAHKCTHISLARYQQWRWSQRTFYCLYQLSEIGMSTFQFIQLRHNTKARLQEPDNDPQVVIQQWWILQNYGIMRELYEVSLLEFEALENDDNENSRLMLIFATLMHASIISIYNTDQTHETALKNFVLKEMHPHVAKIMKGAHSTVDNKGILSTFNRTCFADVFKHTGSTLWKQSMDEILRQVAHIFFAYNNVELGSLYYRISLLPSTTTWTSRIKSLLPSLPTVFGVATTTEGAADLIPYHITAEQDRSNGKMASTLEVLQKMLEKQAPLDGKYERLAYDSIHLLCKLNRHAEAAERSQTLFTYTSAHGSEFDLAGRYNDAYIWARKARFLALPDHADHAEALALLHLTNTTCLQRFGPATLSAAHTAILLHNYYARPCCLDAALAASWYQEFREMFGKLYGGTEKLVAGEGLGMAKVLYAQGALLEAGLCFHELRELAERELGGGDGWVAREAGRWEVETAATMKRWETEAGLGPSYRSVTFTRAELDL
ncbi:hypothetical protein BP6252_13557 [Coleophoma cylindrospora]|uniref:Uncharacterized protein n=1 Tax=Coleophoma cylindrospora TaxID=1849047 RepID=A0A3D8Q8J9_9HELO|nr:hypothetical protein BP6252_13557 [Coleophoma cylindrospora]